MRKNTEAWDTKDVEALEEQRWLAENDRPLPLKSGNTNLKNPVDVEGFKVCGKCRERLHAMTHFCWLKKKNRYRPVCNRCTAETLRRHRMRRRGGTLIRDEDVRDAVLFLRDSE